jgi:hypothetical protein
LVLRCPGARGHHGQIVCVSVYAGKAFLFKSITNLIHEAQAPHGS